MEIRRSAFIRVWKYRPLQKSIVHDAVHDLLANNTVGRIENCEAASLPFVLLWLFGLGGPALGVASTYPEQRIVPSLDCILRADDSGLSRIQCPCLQR